MPDLVAWVFHSPRRLLLVAVALVAVLIGLGAAVRVLTPSASGRPAAAAPTGGASVAGSAAAVEAAVTFTRAWAEKPGSASMEQWRAALHPLVTPELDRLLAATDASALVGGTPSGPPAVRFAAASSALVEVPLSTGRRVLVTVVLLGDRWLVQDVQPAVGDSGDVGGGAAPADGAAPAAGSLPAG